MRGLPLRRGALGLRMIVSRTVRRVAVVMVMIVRVVMVVSMTAMMGVGMLVHG
jgi:hypothetical protein